MCIAEVLSSSRSPWQNPFAERVIGTLRRELLDHVIVLSEGHLRRRLRSYLRYYHGSRTHLALEKDAPQPRAVESPELGRVVARRQCCQRPLTVSSLHPPHDGRAGSITGTIAVDSSTAIEFWQTTASHPDRLCLCASWPWRDWC